MITIIERVVKILTNIGIIAEVFNRQTTEKDQLKNNNDSTLILTYTLVTLTYTFTLMVI